jgi:uncharacterized protein
MTSAEFSFPVTDLDAGGKHLVLPVRASWLRGVLEGTDIKAPEQDGTLDLRISKSGTDVVVRATLDAALVVPCSRCLEPAVVPVHEEISTLAVPGTGESSHKEADDDEEAAEVEDADVIPYDGETLILDDLIRDELLLGIPMIPLCSEACPGIRPEQGASPGSHVADGAAENSEGIDPRLLPLLKLKNKT